MSLWCSGQGAELLERADKPGSTLGDAVFCFFVPLFFCLVSLFLTLFFLMAFFSLFLLLVMHLDQDIRIYTSFVLEKGFQKLLIYILAKLTTRKKP